MSATLLLAPALVSALAAADEPPKSSALEDATRPKLGMQVRSVEVDTGPETYRLTERSWDDVVRDNPALLADRRRTELFAPGLAGVGLGALWLAISTSVTVDQVLERKRREAQDNPYPSFDDDESVVSARAVTFRFIIPTAILVSGAAMAIVGGRARRRLDAAQRAYYLGPQLSQGGGGLTLGGRF